MRAVQTAIAALIVVMCAQRWGGQRVFSHSYTRDLKVGKEVKICESPT